MKKLRIAQLLTFLLSACLVFYHSVMITKAVEWVVCWKLHQITGSKISYESVFRRGNTFYLMKPVFFDTTEQPEGGYRFSSDKIEIAYNFQLFSRVIDLDVDVEHSHLLLVKREEDLPEFPLRFPKSRLFKPLIRSTIEKGILECRDEQFGYSHISKAVFDLSSDFSDQFATDLSLYFSSLDKEERLFSLSFDALRMEVGFKEVSLRDLNPFLDLFNLKSFSTDFKSGKVNGVLSSSYLEGFGGWSGKVKVRDCSFYDSAVECRGSVPELFVRCIDQESSIHLSPALEKTRVEVEILKEGEVLFYDQGIPIWTFKNLKGGISSDGENPYVANFRSNASYLNQSCQFSIGAVLSSNQLSDCVEGSLFTSFYRPFEGGSSSMELTYREGRGESSSSIALDFREFGVAEMKLFQSFSHLFSGNQLDKITLYGGKVSSHIELLTRGGSLERITVPTFISKQLELDLLPLNLSAASNSLTGRFSVDLKEENLSGAIDSNFVIDGGRVKFTQFRQDVWHLSHLDTEFSLSEGELGMVKLQGMFGNLRGGAAVDLNSPGDLIKVHFTGKCEDLYPLVSKKVKRGIEKGNLMEEEINLISALRRGKEGGYELNGVLSFNSTNSSADSIYFGLDLENRMSELWKGEFPFTVETFQSLFGDETSSWISSEEGKTVPLNLGGFIVKGGWLHGKELSYGKYLSPFIFQNSSLELSGCGEVFAQLSGDKIAIKYDGNNLFLDAPSFSCTFGEVREEQEDALAALSGFHLIDLASKKHYGSLPVKGGTYLDKRSGVEFDRIACDFKIENGNVLLKEVEASYRDLQFQGEIAILTEGKREKEFVVDLKVERGEGAAVDFQRMLHQFDLFPFKNLFSSGSVESGEEVSTITFHCYPDRTEIQSNVTGTIKDGVIVKEGVNGRLADLACDFSFDHEKKKLLLSNLSGGAEIFSPGESSERFSLDGGTIDFEDLSSRKFIYDLPFFQGEEVFRLTGGGVREGDGILRIVGDPTKTHLYGNYLESSELQLDQKSRLDQLKIVSPFTSDPLVELLKRSYLIFASNPTPEGIEAVALSAHGGDLDLEVSYSWKKELLEYQAVGERVQFDDLLFAPSKLRGTYYGGHWTVEDFSMGELSFSGDFVPNGDLWHLNFLGVKCGDLFLASAEGDIDPKERRLFGKVNLCEVTLESVEKREWSHSLLKKWGLKGELKGRGIFDLDLTTLHQIENHSFNLDCTLIEGEVDHVSLANGNRFKLCLEKGASFSIDELFVKTGEEELPEVTVEIERLKYERESESYSLSSLSFDLEQHRLSDLADQLKTYFPSLVSEEVVEVICSLKESGVVRGTVDYRDGQLSISMEDGIYSFNSLPFDLKEFRVTIDKEQFQAIAQMSVNDSPIWIGVKAPVQKEEGQCYCGSLTLSEHPPLKLEEGEKVVVDWVVDQESKRLKIAKAVGSCSGVKLNLLPGYLDQEELKREEDVLDGTVQVDFDHLNRYLSAPWDYWVSHFKLGEGYSFHGRWTFPYETWTEFTFEGALHANHFLFGGASLDRGVVNIIYTPMLVSLRDLNIVDLGGSLSVNRIDMERDSEGEWGLFMSDLNIDSFHPPFLRRTEDPLSPVAHNFMIDNLVIEDLNGFLNRPETITGKGTFSFSNPMQSESTNSLLAVPADILSRLGLNSDALNPVSGHVDFSIRDKKLVFDQFRDVFSEGRLSRFYLADSREEYFLDIDGNLYLKVRMRHYNLMFKIADIFTVIVQGPFGSPTFSLQKQQNVARSGGRSSEKKPTAEVVEESNIEISAE